MKDRKKKPPDTREAPGAPGAKDPVTEAGEESFPASDPPSYSSIVRPGTPSKKPLEDPVRGTERKKPDGPPPRRRGR